ncbi:hypothetical protein JXA31_08010 [Candidatus Bathyarchaeota archaeon]|nr:hypothetical protein [Candidatus Bathyarchaeota archaeon]
MANSDIISFEDWDFLKNPVTINEIVDHAKLPQGAKKIILERDDNYNLKGTLKFEDLKFLPERDVVAGSFDAGFKVEGISDDGLTSCVLESCHIGSISFKGANDFVGTADLRISKLKMRCSENTPIHLREWYVNGPSSYVPFRSAEGKWIQYCTEEQFLSKRNQKNSTNIPIANCFSTQVIWCKTKEFRFLITKIPTHGPKWSTNVGIEYHEDWGRIPEIDERLKIEALCSFVFGKHLLSVGCTTYDEDENIVEVYAHSPWGREAKSSCSKPEYPPIRIHDAPKGSAEKLIEYLLPKYMESCEPLCLEEALWNYWISFDVPVGTNLPIIASALETIIENWYKWKKTKSEGLYLETEMFKALLEENLTHIKKKLEKIENGEKIFNKILRANEFGIMERYRVFFEEINLKANKADWGAISGRHRFVHGHANFDEIDWQQVIRQVNTLHTLFNKTLLKILDYKWDYIDRSVEGWPDAQLS